MSWPAYGETWELHHCRPVNDFDFRRNKADVYLVNHWPNLGPLPPLENLSRGDAIQADDIRQLEANLAKARSLFENQAMFAIGKARQVGLRGILPVMPNL